MAYRHTEKVLAKAEARRASMIAAAIDVIARSGLDGLTTDAVAARADVSAGLMYKYFPDKTELLAAVFAHLRGRDLAAIRAAASAEKDPLQALAAALAVFYRRLLYVSLVQACSAEAIYSKEIRDEFERMIPTSLVPAKQRKYAARAALGAMFAMVDAHGIERDRVAATVLFVLRGIGVPEGQARRAVERRLAMA